MDECRKVCENGLQSQKKDQDILHLAAQLSAQRLASMTISVLEEQEEEVVQNHPPENIYLDVTLPRFWVCEASEQLPGVEGWGGRLWGRALKLPNSCLELKKG